MFFLLHSHFLDYPFTLSIKWKFAVIINAFNWKLEGGGWFLIIISYLLYCLYVAHLACCVEWSNSAELETVCSYNMAATPIPVPVAMPGYSAVHNM